MKTLTVSLMRLGDFFHHLPLIRGLPGEIHILGFTELSPIVDLYPQYKFHLINRDGMQRDLVQRDRLWLRAAVELENFVAGLNQVPWNLVINLTHTQFAARMIDLIEAKDKRGIHYKSGLSAGWNSVLKEVNESWATTTSPRLTYVDTLAVALHLMPVEAEPARELRRSGGEIWLQPLTSDEKKNWGLRNWKSLAAQLRDEGFLVRVVCAPKEFDSLSKDFPEVTALTFKKIRENKNSCICFIAGDTSALHFAALEGIRTLGIYLGPANPMKTPPRQDLALVIRGTAPCAPCVHRSACSQTTHECGDSLDPYLVSRTISNALQGKAVFQMDEAGRVPLLIYQVRTYKTQARVAARVPHGGFYEERSRGASAQSVEPSRKGDGADSQDACL